MSNPIYTHALENLDRGLCALPAFAKTKRPAGRWQQFCTRIPSEAELASLFDPHADALCLVTGRASGGAKDCGLMMLDFDQAGKAWPDWCKAVDAGVLRRLVVESTQHGGRHAYWRSARATVPSEKFAMDAEGVLIESRCEHAISICAPSPGYELLQGDFAHVPLLTAEEHDALIAAARAFDRHKAAGEARPIFIKNGLEAAANAGTRPDGGRPGDDYNARGLDDFRQMLERHGWKYVGKSGENEAWRRPGKDEGGLSATFNGQTFFVFSTNAEPFEANVGYSAFHVFALLEHGGDYSAAARALAAQGYGAPRIEVAQPTDEEIADVRRERVRDPGLLDEGLCRADGWIGQLADYTLATAPRPNVRLAFAGALAACAHVAGLARFADACDTRPNLYVLALADSGVGKNAPRKTNKLLCSAIGEGASVIDAFGSGPGLEDCFIDHRAVLSNVDEAHKLFAALKDQDSALAQGIVATMLTMYGESDQVHVFRRLAQSRPSDRNRRPATVSEPHLTLHLSGIPALTFASLSTEAMTGGLAARCVLIEAGPRGPAGTPHRMDLPRDVVDDAMRVCEAVSTRPLVVEETDEARGLRAELTEEADRLYAACPESEQGAADRALYARLLEKAAKVALVLAVSSNMRAPKIERRHLDRAWGIVRHATERMRFLASRYLFVGEFDALAKRALRFLAEYGKPMPRSALLRALHVDARTFDNLVATLTESRQVVSMPGTRQGAVCYKPV